MKLDIVRQTDLTFIIIVGISFLLLALISAAMFYFIFRYSRKRNPVATDITGNTTLEILWTAIPVLLVLVMFYFGYSGFKMMRNAPTDAMNVKVTGRMWAWSYEYENGVKADTLFVPVGKSIKLELNSADVAHSFYMPAFRVKEDVIPGRKNYMWFEPKEEGKYNVECAEYCGLSHAYMLSLVVALPQEKFDSWLINAKTMQTTDTTKAKDTLNIKQDSIKTK
ncbi:MAG TPA: cytochrome c oxidase subunit II [Ignavibacteria bacterium]|nr:cytochrome c oxidase subunit II [Ignavibacteria bacterium]